MVDVVQAFFILNRKKRKRIEAQLYLKNNLKYLEDIPEELLTDLFSNATEFRNFITDNDDYMIKSFDIARQFIDDIQPGHKHQDIHCISYSSSIKSLIGYSIEEFANLFALLRNHIQRRYKDCPPMLQSSLLVSSTERSIFGRREYEQSVAPMLP